MKSAIETIMVSTFVILVIVAAVQLSVILDQVGVPSALSTLIALIVSVLIMRIFIRSWKDILP